MKSLELSLKKRLLIVEPGKDEEIVHLPTNACAIKHTDGTFTHLDNKNDLKFICSGSDINEEKIRELNIIETKPYGSDPGFCTVDYKYNTENNGFRPGFCAPNGRQFTESWISAIESNGFYWGENPIQNAEEYNKALNDNKAWDKRRYSQKRLYFAEIPTYKQQMKLYNEAELKTFNPEKSIIFEILE